MTINKKGQGAMEYLMTYGWAILVVLVIGVALWYMGVFSAGPGGIQRASGFSKMKVADPTIQYSSLSKNLTFTVVNGAGTAVEGFNVTISGGDHGCNTIANISTSVLREGETARVTFGACTKTRGTAYLAYINITYIQSVMGSVMNRQDSGSISGTAE